jgi:citrate synthase
VPGFGHRFHHDGDPRTTRLLELAERAKSTGYIRGDHLQNLQTIGRILAVRKRKALPINVDGIAGAIFLELGFDPVLGRGLIVVARSIGLLAHAWEELCNGERLKGPVPSTVGYCFEGHAPRDMPLRSGE